MASNGWMSYGPIQAKHITRGIGPDSDVYGIRVRTKDPETGKWSYTPTKRIHGADIDDARYQAETWHRQLTRDPIAKQRAQRAAEDITMSGVLDQYKQSRKAATELGNIKAHTPKSERYLLKTIDKHLGHILIRELTPDQVEAFIASMAKAGDSPLKRHKVYMVLNKVIKWAVRKGWRDLNPCDLIDENLIPRKPKANPLAPSGRPFSDAEARDFVTKLLVDFDKSPTGHKMCVLIAFFTGLRRGEIMALRWSDIHAIEDGSGYYFAVTRTMTEDGTVTSAKTHSSLRVVPIPEILSQRLQRWSYLQLEQFTVTGVPVLIDSDGREVDHKGVHGSAKKGWSDAPYRKTIDWQAETTPICTNRYGQSLGYYTYDRWWHRYAPRLINEHKLVPDADGGMSIVSIEFDIYPLLQYDSAAARKLSRDDKEARKLQRKQRTEDRLEQAKHVPTLHSLRATYATILHREGVPLITIQKYMGHVSYSTTINNYLHAEDAADPQVAEILAKHFDPSGTATNADGYPYGVTAGTKDLAPALQPYAKQLSRYHAKRDGVSDIDDDASDDTRYE